MNGEQSDTALGEALTTKDETVVKEACYRLDSFLIGEDEFPELTFRHVVRAIRSQEFRDCPGSWRVIGLIEENRELLTADQETILAALLEDLYAAFPDWMQCFMTTDLLPDLGSESSALDRVLRLKQKVTGMPRLFIPHAFEHLIIRNPSGPVASRAFDELHRLSRDESEDVRNEVAESFGRLRNRRLLP